MLKNKMIRTITLSAVDDDSKISGIANSLTKTRNGITVTEDAVSGLSGKKVPLLANHRWDTQPIGAVTIGDADEEGLHYTGKIFDTAPDRDLILEAIKAGVESVSIGFKVLDYEGQTVNKLDLLELSVTPVPADAGATVEVLDMNDDNKNTTTTGQDDSQDPKTDDKTGSQYQPIVDAINSGFKSLTAAIKAQSSDKPDGSDNKQDPDVTEDLKDQLKTVLSAHPEVFSYEGYKKAKKLVEA